MTTTTRLKMNLRAVSNVAGSGEDNPLCRVNLGAVYSADPSSDSYIFGKYTPYGELSFNVIPEVAEKLVVGQDYYVDLTPAE